MNIKCKNKNCNNIITGKGKTDLCGSCSRKGKKRKPFSKEWKENMSKASKKRWSNPKEHEKLSKAHKGKTRTEEHKQNISKALKGKKRGPHTEEAKKNISKALKGRKLTEEWIENLSKSQLKRFQDPKERKKISGENSVHYIHGQGYDPYSKDFTPTLRKEIRERDNHTCQCCGMTQAEHLEKYNNSLDIHHIDYNKMNCDKDNLITLCHKCNMKANFNIDYWYAFYTYIMENEIETIKT
jgi:hypothetical protein